MSIRGKCAFDGTPGRDPSRLLGCRFEVRACRVTVNSETHTVSRLLPAVVLVAGLCACATPDEMRHGKPFVELTSVRQAKDVALCIAKRWENSGYGGTPSVKFRLSETGYIVAVRNE
jgi:hypothetical protein